MNKPLSAWVVVLFVALAGCLPGSPMGGPAPAAPVPAREAVSITTEQVAALASILRAEDTRDPEIAPLLAHLSSPSAIVRARAAIALGALRAGVPHLVGLLADPDTSVAASAAFALGQAGDSSAVAALAALLGSDLARERVTVADEAAYALGKLGAEAGRAAIRQYLADSRVDDGWRAPVTRSALLAIWRFPRDQREEPVARWTTSRDPEIRWRATYALVRRPDPRGTAVLRGLLGDADERVRALAVRGLTAALSDSAGIGAAETLADLLRALDDSSYLVRINAIGALGTYRDPASVQALTARLAGRPTHEAFAASEALGRLGEAALTATPPLDARVRDRSAPVALRRVALEALNRISPPAAVSAARAVTGSSEWRLRAAAAAVLARHGEPETDRLLRDPDGRVANAALQARVAAAGDSLRPLRPLLLGSLDSRDTGVRTTALGALRVLADPATLPAVLDAYAVAVTEPQNDVALAALGMLAALRSPSLDPGRSFFARFQRPEDPLVHRLAVERFGEQALRAWGPAVPISTGRTMNDYELVVRERIVPELQLRGGPSAIVQTESGTITLRLFGAAAPLTVESFATLAAQGYFDGQEWPRVVPNFVVQGGDPTGDTSGGPGYSIRDENNRHRYGTGTLGMALSGPDTGGSQFFITHSPQPHLDGIYAIFGQVIAGQDVTERILPGESILSIRIEDR